ncbi:MAG: LL-diaminopimelate aminotransferase [Thermodesulfovibrionales bacterium]|nr:LL-diaminopimelate aminotransferase [Thermodesulfovibrionales bacterium]
MPELSDRVKNLQPYPFVVIEQKKREALAKGVDLIDLSIGDPDLATPEFIVESLRKAAGIPDNHHYPSSAGMMSFREAVARWYDRRSSIKLDPASEVVSLIGSKEAVGHMPLAYINPGDVVLVPSPGYPVYEIGTMFAGGACHFMPLTAGNGFLPDLDAIPADVCKRARLMWLNYPNNPTAALAPREFFEKAIGFAKEHDIIIVHDAAYSEMYFDGNKPLSFLEVDGAREVGIEMHSLSKTYNMTGWRIGYAVGNSDIIAGLAKIKSNLDSGVFQAVQEAAITALDSDESVLDGIRKTYQARRDAMYDGLHGAGFEVNRPGATFYLWMKVPGGQSSAGYAAVVLEKAGVLATPGSGFGGPGEGYIRFALTDGVERIKEAVERIKAI